MKGPSIKEADWGNTFKVSVTIFDLIGRVYFKNTLSMEKGSKVLLAQFE